MSKSRGNVVRTETILDAFGALCPTVPVLNPTNPSADDAALSEAGPSGGKQGLQPPEIDAQ